MNVTQPRPTKTPDAETILAELSVRQFVRPHRRLAEAVADARDRLGFCEAAAAQAMSWLDLDPSVAIGRLKRAELAQLSRSIHRLCTQAQPESRPIAAPPSCAWGA